MGCTENSTILLFGKNRLKHTKFDIRIVFIALRMYDFGAHASFRQSVTKFLAKNLPRDVLAARPDFRRKAIDA